MEFNRIICVYKTLVGFLVVIGQKRYQRNVSELFTERSYNNKNQMSCFVVLNIFARHD